MQITTAPIALPITTANPPTEAVANEAAKKVPIPKSTPTTENTQTRNSTESNAQPKTNQELDKVVEQKKQQTKDQSQQQNESDEQSQNDQKLQQQKKQQKAQQAKDDRVIQQLKNIDREVKNHELAHAAAGGQYTGAPQLSYTLGPDGKKYAVSGEVSIDTSRVANNPQATINKMRQVRQAALAPINPSSQDLKIAALASQRSNQAQIDLNLERLQESGSKLNSASRADGKPKASASSSQSSENALRSGSHTSSADVPRPETPRPETLRPGTSTQLNKKIAQSGALDDEPKKSTLSQIA